MELPFSLSLASPRGSNAPYFSLSFTPRASERGSRCLERSALDAGVLGRERKRGERKKKESEWRTGLSTSSKTRASEESERFYSLALPFFFSSLRFALPLHLLIAFFCPRTQKGTRSPPRHVVSQASHAVALPPSGERLSSASAWEQESSPRKERKGAGRAAAFSSLCFDWRGDRPASGEQQQSLVFAEARGPGFLPCSLSRVVLDSSSLRPCAGERRRVKARGERAATLVVSLDAIAGPGPAAADASQGMPRARPPCSLLFSSLSLAKNPQGALSSLEPR